MCFFSKFSETIKFNFLKFLRKKKLGYVARATKEVFRKETPHEKKNQIRIGMLRSREQKRENRMHKDKHTRV
jgi:hypothetical protein